MTTEQIDWLEELHEADSHIRSAYDEVGAVLYNLEQVGLTKVVKDLKVAFLAIKAAHYHLERGTNATVKKHVQTAEQGSTNMIGLALALANKDQRA